MKYNFFTILALLLMSLPENSFGQGKVDIIAETEVQEAEESRLEKRKASNGKVKGYRIMVGFYSNRAEAEALRSEAAGYFEATYGVKMIYDEPNFKVYVGSFSSADEADEALIVVKKKFKGATRISDIIQRKTATQK
jgi:hypothetical protein